MLPLLLPRKTNANGKDSVKSKMTPYVQHGLSFTSANRSQAFFNVMIQEFGVRGVKVQEVFGLDEALLAMLP